jgi:SAM-dependent methyltransferase
MSGPSTASAVSQRPCPWCGAPLRLDTAADGLVRCRYCRVAATHPWPSDEELARAYAGWYRPQTGRFMWIGDQLLAFSRGRMAKRLDRLAPPGPVLDVGAGDGTLVRAIAATGREAHGLERDTGPAGIQAAELTEIDGRWAAVVFWHSLEHLREPGAALAHAAELLIPGGVLVLAVPNPDSWQARIFGPRWFALDPPRHLVHVSCRALTARLRELGLGVERVSHWRGGQIVFGWLAGLVGSLPGAPDLYDAIRRPAARRATMPARRRAGALLVGLLLFPIAAIASMAEVAAGRGGTVYIEARRG